MITAFLLTALIAAPASVFAAAPAPAPAASTAAVNAAVTAANQRFAARCAREPMAVEELLADPVFRVDMTYAAGEERQDLLDFASCRALQGAAAACSQLEPPGRPATGDAVRCRTTEAESRFAFMAVRGGDALPACRKAQEIEGQRGPAADRDCVSLIALVRAEREKLSCDSLARAKLVTPQDSCESIRAYWSGLSGDCERGFVNATDRRDCRARALLVAGLRVPAQCAASPYCQALTTRSPAACEPPRAKFARGLCARVAKDLAAEQKRLAREQELLARQAKEKADAQAAAAAALRAKAEAALARSRAEQLAAEEKVRKTAEVQAAKKAAVEAAVKAKAEAEARKAAEAKAKVERADKPQFRKGEAMQKEPPEVREMMKAIEEGRPLPKPKPKPRKAVPPDETPSGE